MTNTILVPSMSHQDVLEYFSRNMPAVVRHIDKLLPYAPTSRAWRRKLKNLGNRWFTLGDFQIHISDTGVTKVFLRFFNHKNLLTLYVKGDGVVFGFYAHAVDRFYQREHIIQPDTDRYRDFVANHLIHFAETNSGIVTQDGGLFLNEGSLIKTYISSDEIKEGTQRQSVERALDVINTGWKVPKDDNMKRTMAIK